MTKFASRFRLTYVLPLFLLGLITTLWVAIQAVIAHDREMTLHHQQEIDHNLVRALEEHVDSVVREVDQTVTFLKYRFEHAPQTVDILELLNNEIIINRYFTQLGIIDANGMLIMTNKKPFKRMDLNDREHIKVHKGAEDIGLFISKPVLGRSSGKWSIQFTRRIDNGKGQFGGVVVVSVDPFYFTNMYQDFNTAQGGALMLVGMDGIVRTSRSSDRIRMGDDVSKTSWFPRIQPGAYYQGRVIDEHGDAFWLSAHKLANHNIAVALLNRESTLLVEHDERARRLNGLGALATVFLLLTGGYIIWQASRLQESQVKAESANRMKSEFLAHMSHELRTPLNGILGSAELIQESQSLEEARELSGLIRSSGDMLKHQVDMVLDLAKLEAGKVTLNLANNALGQLLTLACDQHESFARKKGLAILRNWDEAALGVGRVDGLRLVEVISNLVHNALKFTDSGEVSVQASREKHQLLVTVSDSGVGIASDELPYIFDKFRQVERFVTRSQGGSGLGLALVKEWIELMQGRVSVSSVVGKGSHFTVTIPLQDD